jgi:hypothetical protein
VGKGFFVGSHKSTEKLEDCLIFSERKSMSILKRGRCGGWVSWVYCVSKIANFFGHAEKAIAVQKSQCIPQTKVIGKRSWKNDVAVGEAIAYGW